MSDVKSDVKARVTQVVGGAALAPDADLPSFAVDGIVPAVVVMPESAEQVSRLLAFAGEAGLAVVPWGGGSAMSVGGVPRAVDIVLSTSRLNKVLDYSPEDMTVTAQAGVTLATLQALLAGRGQMLPLDPPLPERSTVGGILATNASGPLRYQFGMPRDLALGAVVVYPDGAIAKSGGRTVKNVAGYDMTRLHIGAYGTLGVIVEATFKVSPLPKVLVSAVGSFGTLSAAAAAAKALRMARIVPWSLVLAESSALPGLADGYTVAVRLGGQPAVVTPQLQRALDTLREAQGNNVGEMKQAEEAFWPRVRDWAGTAGAGDGALVRAGVVPSQVEKALAAFQDVATRHALTAASLAFPGAATIYCHLVGRMDGIADAVAAMQGMIGDWNGNLVVERCPRALKERVAVWGPGGADALTQRVKQTYDPKSILNPGRFVGGL